MFQAHNQSPWLILALNSSGFPPCKLTSWIELTLWALSCPPNVLPPAPLNFSSSACIFKCLSLDLSDSGNAHPALPHWVSTRVRAEALTVFSSHTSWARAPDSLCAPQCSLAGSCGERLQASFGQTVDQNDVSYAFNYSPFASLGVFAITVIPACHQVPLVWSVKLWKQNTLTFAEWGDQALKSLVISRGSHWPLMLPHCSLLEASLVAEKVTHHTN